VRCVRVFEVVAERFGFRARDLRSKVRIRLFLSVEIKEMPFDD